MNDKLQAENQQLTNALEVQGIHKSFGKLDVLQDVSFTVREGEFVSLIGPSGSGKSTLFQIIGGLVAPTKGQIYIGGRETTGQRGLISYMPQQAALLPWRSVSDNIVLALEIAGVSRGEAQRLTAEWLPRVGLADYAQAYPHVLSGGMQQRVSFLRALLSPAGLMCLDEPFSALDELTRLHMQRWLLQLWEQSKRSVLLITHSIEEALLLSDRIVVLTAQPATVALELEVPFARPRQEQLWTDPAFNEMKAHIYELLKQGGDAL